MFSRDTFGNCKNDKYSEVHKLKAPSGCIFAHVMGAQQCFINLTQGDGELLSNWHMCVKLGFYFCQKMHGVT